MADHSAIEWCDSTFNPWEGCTKVGPGCDNCYAEARNARFAGGTSANLGPGAPRRRTSPANWKLPLAWNRQQYAACADCSWRGEWRDFWVPTGDRVGDYPMGTARCPSCGGSQRVPARRRVFCASLADVFDNEAPAQWRADLFALIEKTPNLDWLLLTKRIGNVERMVTEACDLIDHGEGWQSLWGQGEWPANVWLGATIVNQDEANRDLSKLLAIPAAVRFLSIEPMLGLISLNAWLLSEHGRRAIGAQPGIDWVICGGESGPRARPLHTYWVRALRDQCAAAGVPFLFKQRGEFAHSERTMADIAASNLKLISVPYSTNNPYPIDLVDRVGKKLAGRTLDGRTHDGFPAVAP